MATNTTNFDLKKPAYTDTADIADINGNMDKVDVSLNGLADAIAIVAKNNTHAAITAGQYVYVHGHGSLAEGLYTAKSNIAANATLSTSNLQADGTGGLNALNSKLTRTTSTTLTADNAGRLFLRVAPEKLLSVAARDTDHWCVVRYILSDGQAASLIYVYNIGTLTPVANGTSITIDYTYIA